MPEYTHKRNLSGMLQLWLQISVVCSYLFAIWLASKFNVQSRHAAVFLLTAYGTTVLVTYLRKSEFTRKVLSLRYAAAFAAGIVLWGTDFTHMHTWIDASLSQHGIVVARDADAEGIALPSLSAPGDDIAEDHKEKSAEDYDIVVHEGAREIDMLIAFDDGGQIRLNGGDLTKLQSDLSLFMVTRTDDGTFVLRTKKEGGDVFMYLAKPEGDRLRIRKSFPIPYTLHHWGGSFDNVLYHIDTVFTKTPSEVSEMIGGEFHDCSPTLTRADSVSLIDLDEGRVTKTFNVLGAIARADSRFDDLKKLVKLCFDPLHMNDAQALKNEFEASLFPGGKIGDILVSARNINSLLLLDGFTGDIKWYHHGKSDGHFLTQHSPRITERGTIVLFDNRGSDPQNGKSRVVEIDPRTHEMVGYFEERGDGFFHSWERGRVEILSETEYLVEEQAASPTKTNTTFILECDDGRLSLDCERTDLFTVTIPDNLYHNALPILPSH